MTTISWMISWTEEVLEDDSNSCARSQRTIGSQDLDGDGYIPTRMWTTTACVIDARISARSSCRRLRVRRWMRTGASMSSRAAIRC